MPYARSCSECAFRLAVARVTIQPKFESPEQHWLCNECAANAVQDWLFGSQWLDVEAVTLVRL